MFYISFVVKSGIHGCSSEKFHLGWYPIFFIIFYKCPNFASI